MILTMPMISPDCHVPNIVLPSFNFTTPVPFNEYSSFCLISTRNIFLLFYLIYLMYDFSSLIDTIELFKVDNSQRFFYFLSINESFLIKKPWFVLIFSDNPLTPLEKWFFILFNYLSFLLLRYSIKWKGLIFYLILTIFVRSFASSSY